MKARGRKHSFADKVLMKQVSVEFKRKKDELGAKKAAEVLKVCPASFYNYVAGTDVPRREVLRVAQEKWGIKWKYIDPSELLRATKIQSSEQLAFTFLAAVREQDVKVVKIRREGHSILRVALQIRFSA